MKVAIYGRSTNENVSEYIQLLFNKIDECNIEVFIYQPFYAFIKNKLTVTGNIKTFSSHIDLKGNVDYLLSLGGDGTILETLTLVRDSEIPVFRSRRIQTMPGICGDWNS